jgi:hypothetical protein
MLCHFVIFVYFVILFSINAQQHQISIRFPSPDKE